MLLPVRELKALVALDLEGEGAMVRWYPDGSWRLQDEAVPLPTGSMLLFDNHGARRPGVRGRSRVIEFAPAEGTVTWEYAGAGARGLSSPVGRSYQRLADGNTLVIESTAGRALEVAREGEVVREFVSPHRAGEDDAFHPQAARRRVPPERRRADAQAGAAPPARALLGGARLTRGASPFAALLGPERPPPADLRRNQDQLSRKSPGSRLPK